ncbi:chromosome condensation complex Condensin, subunit G [Tieghemiomyces parasiticus]|uniref:Chromosome condensation complex Condensin, subunit G n=1 Tax=Tieghemiomyces parasiticus TaxID=78921 RepID=A0A9W8DJZ1_9FUNG|nr:chromosome condensation complex Condensin, subunit G [Tieghemiomyces parasiticus]
MSKTDRDRPRPTADILHTLATAVPEIFNDSQTSAAQHRRNAAALRKLQERCAQLSPEDIARYMSARTEPCPLVCSTSAYPGESVFNNEFVRNLNKVLPVKKREPSVELVIRFVAAFAQYGHEKDNKLAAAQATSHTEGRDAMQVDGDVFTAPRTMATADAAALTSDESISSRFIEFLMHYLLQGFEAKEKPVRLRVVQLVALCVNSFGEIDEDLYLTLKAQLYERIHDKESAIRVQAVIALCRLQNGEDEDTADERDGPNVTKTLSNIIRYDPSAEVRRAVLLNIAHTPHTLPRILERSRDMDTTNRRFVYLRAMREVGDFRILSIDAREKLLSHGIQDRETSVRQAAVRMVAENWMEYVDNNLVELLERLDVVNSTVAERTLLAVFNDHPDIPRTFEFADEVWQNLTPETAFLIRVSLEFFRQTQADEHLDAAQPEAIKLAQYVEQFTQQLQSAEDDDQEADLAFIVRQLLLIATLCDFADELGRRKFLTLLREMLLLPDIPENQIEIIIDLILKLSINERDFTRIIVEAISEIRASIEDDEDAQAADRDPDERQLELLLMKVKCLIISKLLLERCQEQLRANNTVFGLLNEFIIPAIQESEAIIQELGIVCLAHCCYLDRTLAEENTQAFIEATRRGEGDIREKALMALCDLAFMYDLPSLSKKLEDEQVIERVLLECVESSEPEIQALATEGIVRLLYGKKLPNPATVIETLLVLYFHPITADNNRFRQCLSYFFQVFSYSSPDNQRQVQKAVIPTILQLAKFHKSVWTTSSVSMVQAAQQMIDWADPRIIVAASLRANRVPIDVDEGLHADIAEEALRAIFSVSSSVRRTLVILIRKLNVDENAGLLRLHRLHLLLCAIMGEDIIGETVLKRQLPLIEEMFTRPIANLTQHLPPAELEQMNEKLADSLVDVAAFIDRAVQAVTLTRPAPPVVSQPVPPSPHPSKVLNPDFKPTGTSRGRGGVQPMRVIVKVEDVQREMDAMLEDSDGE